MIFPLFSKNNQRTCQFRRKMSDLIDALPQITKDLHAQSEWLWRVSDAVTVKWVENILPFNF